MGNSIFEVKTLDRRKSMYTLQYNSKSEDTAIKTIQTAQREGTKTNLATEMWDTIK